MSFIFIALWLYLTYKLSSSLFKKIDKWIERATWTVVSSVGGFVWSWVTSVSSSIARNIIKKPLVSLGKKWLDLWKSAVWSVKDSAKEKIKDSYDQNVKPTVDDISKSLWKVWDKVDKLKEWLVDTVGTAIASPITWSLNLIWKILDKKVQLIFYLKKKKIKSLLNLIKMKIMLKY